MKMGTIELFKKFAPKENNFAQKTNAIIYTRVSTKDQAETNTSLETQKKHCEFYAKNHGMTVVGYFGGTHESAKNDDRKEFKRMLKFAKQSSSVGHIIVYSYDRFSRTGTEAAQIIKNLLPYGIRVNAVTQEVDVSSASGKLHQSMLLIFSEFDNNIRKDKTITAMTDLLRKGYWLWTPPRGYTNNNKYQKAAEWKIEINEEGKLLKKAFQWKVNGAYSNAEICRKLSTMGMNLDERRLLEIFQNPFYAGILTTRLLPGEPVEGKHPKIVSQADFLKINNCQSNHPEKHTQENDELPLKQFTLCSACNTPLTGFEVKAKRLYYYKCRTKGCNCNKSAKQMHNQFQDELKSLQVDSKYLDIIRDVMIYTYDSVTHEIRDKETYVKKKLTELKNKLSTIEERYAIGEIDREIYQKFAPKYNSEIQQLEDEITNSTFSSSNLDFAIKKALDLSTKLSEIWLCGYL
jgi:DNA invertase Pin-like site-specific DNA recombinase